MDTRPQNLTFLQRLVAPGIFRLFLAVVVVAAHFTPFNCGVWAVYVFFMLSGYWIAVMYIEKYQFTKNRFFTFLCSRFWRLYPVYFVSSLLLIVILRISSKHWAEFSFVYNPLWAARSAIILSSSDQPMLMKPAWSLDVELQFYIVAPFLIMWITRASLPQALGAVAAVGFASLFFWPYNDLPRFIVFFLVGLLIYRSRWRPSALLAIGSLCAAALAVTVCIYVPAWHGAVIFDPDKWVDAVNYRFMSALAILTTPYVAYTVRQPATRLDYHFGNLAYSVYLSHTCVYVFVIYFGGFHSPVRNFISHLRWPLVPVAAIPLYLLVDQPSERLRKRFVGGRVISAAKQLDVRTPPAVVNPTK